MQEKENDKYLEETMKSIEEKEEKSLKRLKMFSWVFFLIGLEVINITLQMKIEPLIMVLIIDLFALVVAITQHKVGLKSGCAIEKEFRKLDNQSNKEREDLLLKTIFELRKNKSGE